jgi:phospholipid/cholesterol/gamma-HCH transport system ATP-binding protein
MVTHDLNTLAGLATHVAVLADQHIVAFGPREEIMTVDHPFVNGFFGADRQKLL